MLFAIDRCLLCGPRRQSRGKDNAIPGKAEPFRTAGWRSRWLAGATTVPDVAIDQPGRRQRCDWFLRAIGAPPARLAVSDSRAGLAAPSCFRQNLKKPSLQLNCRSAYSAIPYVHHITPGSSGSRSLYRRHEFAQTRADREVAKATEMAASSVKASRQFATTNLLCLKSRTVTPIIKNVGWCFVGLLSGPRFRESLPEVSGIDIGGGECIPSSGSP